MVIWLVVVNQKTVGKHGHLEAFQLKAIIILYFLLLNCTGLNLEQLTF